jgi:hypothetical protein
VDISSPMDTSDDAVKELDTRSGNLSTLSKHVIDSTNSGRAISHARGTSPEPEASPERDASLEATDETAKAEEDDSTTTLSQNNMVSQNDLVDGANNIQPLEQDTSHALDLTQETAVKEESPQSPSQGVAQREASETSASATGKGGEGETAGSDEPTQSDLDVKIATSSET